MGTLMRPQSPDTTLLELGIGWTGGKPHRKNFRDNFFPRMQINENRSSVPHIHVGGKM